MKRYVIERNIPGVGGLNREQFKGVAATSNRALEKLPGRVQWEQSYVVDDKIFCVYHADNAGLVKEHARRGGFPADAVMEVRNVIDPSTAER